MSKHPESSTTKTKREDRLKAALRANLSRRKAQDRARAADPEWREDGQADEAGGDAANSSQQES